MKFRRRYYGIRYMGGNRTCTTGHPHPTTGRYSLAVDVAVFRTARDRDEWVSNSRPYAATAYGGGERIPATLKSCREHCQGMSMEDFRNMLDCEEFERYEE